MGGLVLDFAAIDAAAVALVGGKGAQLAALARVEGVAVPPGFVVSTAALRPPPALEAALARAEEDGGAALRAALSALTLPEALQGEIRAALARLGPDEAYAVRSSATAEDAAGASFAGLHDSFLDLRGAEAVLRHVLLCWASLWSDRARAYRARRGPTAEPPAMAVVVQRMVHAEVAGVLFTADPLGGDRRVSVIEATPGLGEALVAGRVRPDRFRVQSGQIRERVVLPKPVAVRSAPGGGTVEQTAGPAEQNRPALTDAELLALEALGRRIEAASGGPRDIEWCLRDGRFWVVQSRPITTLFPVPEPVDGALRVYLSVGHQQMMTDAMRPLGLSVFQRTALRPMVAAGGRLFVDVSAALAAPGPRAGLFAMAGRADPLTGDALKILLDRGDFGEVAPVAPPPGPPPAPALGEADPALVPALIARAEASLAAIEGALGALSGPALFERLNEDLEALRRLLLDPESTRVVFAAIDATWWVNERMEAWLGEKNAADALMQAAPHNPTIAMGLALLELADRARPFPALVAALQRGAPGASLDALAEVEGGASFLEAMGAFLSCYGMRCVGEIDLTRPRWSEDPAAILPVLRANLSAFAPGEAARRVAEGQARAEARTHELLARLEALPGGADHAAEARVRIGHLRAYSGFREFPKFSIVRRFFVYKRAILAEAARLVEAGVLARVEDCYFLRLEELEALVRAPRPVGALVRAREAEHRVHEALRPPRVLTSHGETLDGAYHHAGVPAGALPGLAVSGGVVEGRARVLHSPGEATLGPEDILVTTFADPSWTPLFLSIRGLVTEVGGLMAHGAVIARELGLPAVVGVDRATARIRDGQRIRVHGALGYVELLPDDP